MQSASTTGFDIMQHNVCSISQPVRQTHAATVKHNARSNNVTGSALKTKNQSFVCKK